MNHGHLAWQRSETPRIFRIPEDPSDYASYLCLCAWRDGRLAIEDLRFDFDIEHIFRATDGFDLTDEVEWATFGQRVLRDGRIARIEDIADQFYDHRRTDSRQRRQRCLLGVVGQRLRRRPGLADD
jgi:hypothetical protein